MIYFLTISCNEYFLVNVKTMKNNFKRRNEVIQNSNFTGVQRFVLREHMEKIVKIIATARIMLIVYIQQANAYVLKVFLS